MTQIFDMLKFWDVIRLSLMDMSKHSSLLAGAENMDPTPSAVIRASIPTSPFLLTLATSRNIAVWIKTFHWLLIKFRICKYILKEELVEFFSFGPVRVLLPSPLVLLTEISWFLCRSQNGMMRLVYTIQDRWWKWFILNF